MNWRSVCTVWSYWAIYALVPAVFVLGFVCFKELKLGLQFPFWPPSLELKPTWAIVLTQKVKKWPGIRIHIRITLGLGREIIGWFFIIFDVMWPTFGASYFSMFLRIYHIYSLLEVCLYSKSLLSCNENIQFKQNRQ